MDICPGRKLRKVLDYLTQTKDVPGTGYLTRTGRRLQVSTEILASRTLSFDSNDPSQVICVTGVPTSGWLMKGRSNTVGSGFRSRGSWSGSSRQSLRPSPVRPLSKEKSHEELLRVLSVVLQSVSGHC